MILDTIDNSEIYAKVHAGFAAAFDFLKNTDWKAVEDGKHEIPGTEAFVIVASDMGRGKSDSPLEVHRKYIDIQVVLEGKELIGWSPLNDCRQPKAEFDVTKDIQFYSDVPQTWCSMRAGQFAIFYPSDAHAPLAASGPVRKAVVKVPLA